VIRLKKVLEKGFLASLGFWLLLHEKADEIIRDLIRKGKMAPEEGRKFLDELAKKAEEEKEAIKERIGEITQTTFKEFGFVTKEEYESLLKRIEKLEKEVGVKTRRSKKQ
jgi:polyhydroxyalkanoate synthesis regulator phasin